MGRSGAANLNEIDPDGRRIGLSAPEKHDDYPPISDDEEEAEEPPKLFGAPCPTTTAQVNATPTRSVMEILDDTTLKSLLMA